MGDGSKDCAARRYVESRPQDADTAIEALAESYEVWAGDDLNNAKKVMKAARAMPSGRQPQIRMVFDVVHDMKGQGGTFGTDPITLIGQSLGDFIRHVPDATDGEPTVMDRHPSAMAMVLDERIKGAGGSFAGKIRARLKHIIAAARE